MQEIKKTNGFILRLAWEADRGSQSAVPGQIQVHTNRFVLKHIFSK